MASNKTPPMTPSSAFAPGGPGPTVRDSVSPPSQHPPEVQPPHDGSVSDVDVSVELRRLQDLEAATREELEATQRRAAELSAKWHDLRNQITQLGGSVVGEVVEPTASTHPVVPSALCPFGLSDAGTLLFSSGLMEEEAESRKRPFPQSTSTFMDFVEESVDPASEWRDFQSLQDSMSRESTAMSHEFSSETASLYSIDSGLSAAKTPQTQRRDSKRRRSVDESAEVSLCQSLSSTLGRSSSGATAMTVIYFIFWFCPEQHWDLLYPFVEGLDADRFVQFCRILLSDQRFKGPKFPKVAELRDSIKFVKTRADPSHKLTDVVGKFKGNTFWYIYDAEKWRKQKTTNPPWPGCVRLEFLQLLSHSTVPKDRRLSEHQQQVLSFFNDEFYDYVVATVKKVSGNGFVSENVQRLADSSREGPGASCAKPMEQALGNTKAEEEFVWEELELLGAHGDSKKDLARQPRAIKFPVHRVALTGGPCAGKTEGLKVIKEDLTTRGFAVYPVPEAATILFGGLPPQEAMQSSSNRVKFHIELLRLQIALEEKFLRLIPIAGKPVVILCDRGCMDGAAYLSPDEWRQVLDEMNLSEDHLLRRYDHVIHLETAAKGDDADKHYVKGHTENTIRSESVEDARQIDDKLKTVWARHPSKKRTIPKSVYFEDKMFRLRKELGKCVGLPSEGQAYQKFKLHFDEGDLENVLSKCCMCHELRVDITYLKGSRANESTFLRHQFPTDNPSFGTYLLCSHVVHEDGTTEWLKQGIKHIIYFNLKRDYCDETRRELQQTRWQCIWMDDQNQKHYFGLQKYEEPMVYLLTQDSEASRLPPTILQPYVVRDVTEDGSYSSVSLSRLDVSAELLN